MSTKELRELIDADGTKAAKRKLLRRHARAFEQMQTTLAILHTWCKHDPQRTTHGQIVALIDATLNDVKGLTTC